MRTNFPVHDIEYPFPPGATLVSTTDLKGRILHCNAAFVEVSGYEREELLGQPHNLIRHPDMPEEAFRDLWHTIQHGRPWTAPVKNRRKDGSFYWVQANVTPVLEGGRAVAYMSVRTEPEPDAVRAAEALYATMRSEKAQGRLVHRLQGAQPHRAGMAGWPAHARAWLGEAPRMLTAAMLLAAGALLGAWAMQEASWQLPVLALVLAVPAGAWLLGRQLETSLAPWLAFANRMAGGDLTQRVAQRGRGAQAGLAQALNQLNVNLRSVVGDARGEAQAMRHATALLAAGNRELSQRTESQAANLEQTAAAIDQTAGTARQVAEAAQEASRLAGEAQQVTRRGAEAVAGLGETMRAVQASSQRIGEITGLIDSIAFQTNILALNASVEAARAGAQGRGFAVVATEVRALAGRSAQAARQIKSLIEEAQQDVRLGTRRAESAASTMAEVQASVRRVGALATSVSEAVAEQLVGIDQIHQAVAQLDPLTQRNAALVEETADAAEQLHGRAQSVTDAMGLFRVQAGETTRAQEPAAVVLRRRARGVRAAPRLLPIAQS